MTKITLLGPVQSVPNCTLNILVINEENSLAALLIDSKIYHA